MGMGMGTARKVSISALALENKMEWVRVIIRSRNECVHATTADGCPDADAMAENFLMLQGAQCGV